MSLIICSCTTQEHWCRFVYVLKNAQLKPSYTSNHTIVTIKVKYNSRSFRDSGK